MGRKKSSGNAAAKTPAQFPPEAAGSQAGDPLGPARSLYARLPLVPFLDRQTSAILYLCVAGYLLAVALFAASSPVGGGDFQLREGPLLKNSQLLLFPGELYGYRLASGGQARAIHYQVQSMPGCSGAAIYEIGGELPPQCITPGGNLATDASRYNSTLPNSSIIMFSPWMLAASESFSWQVEGEYLNGYLKMRIRSAYESLGSRRVLGRDAFFIRETSDAFPPTDYYIDSEKRVLLYAVSGNNTAMLVSAPFGIDSSQVPD